MRRPITRKTQRLNLAPEAPEIHWRGTLAQSWTTLPQGKTGCPPSGSFLRLGLGLRVGAARKSLRSGFGELHGAKQLRPELYDLVR